MLRHITPLPARSGGPRPWPGGGGSQLALLATVALPGAWRRGISKVLRREVSTSVDAPGSAAAVYPLTRASIHPLNDPHDVSPC